MMKARLFAVALGAAVAILAAPAQAKQPLVAATMSVSAVVPANCRLTVSSLAFGSYDPLAENSTAALDGTASLVVTCTREARGKILMDTGQSNTTAPIHYMLSGGQRLAYELFRDSARTQAWGAGENAFEIVGAGVQAPQSFTVYGRIPGGQDVAPGTYSDVVTATVDF